MCLQTPPLVEDPDPLLTAAQVISSIASHPARRMLIFASIVDHLQRVDTRVVSDARIVRNLQAFLALMNAAVPLHAQLVSTLNADTGGSRLVLAHFITVHKGIVDHYIRSVPLGDRATHMRFILQGLIVRNPGVDPCANFIMMCAILHCVAFNQSPSIVHQHAPSLHGLFARFNEAGASLYMSLVAFAANPDAQGIHSSLASFFAVVVRATADTIKIGVDEAIREL